MKNKLNAFYAKHKREIHIFSAGFATASVIAYKLHANNEVVAYSVGDDADKNYDVQLFKANGKVDSYPTLGKHS